ncbi:hypothetical protein MXB_3252, partial [Myxobolus squamalis]
MIEIACFFNTKNVTDLTYAFIRYTNTCHALAAIKQFDGFDLGKNMLKVEFAHDKKEIGKNNDVIDRNNDKVSKHSSCDVCGKFCTTRCGRCKSITYCSVECQKIDYEFHKNHCFMQHPTSMTTIARTDSPLVANLVSPNNNKSDRSYSPNKCECFDQTPIMSHVKLAPSLLRVNEVYSLKIAKYSKFYKFRLIDYGVTILATSKNAVVLEDKELCDIPPLCICGVFDGMRTLGADLLEAEEKFISPKLISVLGNIHVFESVKMSQPTTSLSLIFGAKYDVNVMYIDDSDHLFVRSTDLISKNLYNTFIRLYNENSSEPIVENKEFVVGDIVKCKSKDDRFRRAKIVKIMESMASVLFIDSSDQMIVQKSNISHIPPIHKYFPPLVFQCTLEDGRDLRKTPVFSEYQKRRRDNLQCIIEIIGIDPNSIYIIKIIEILQTSSSSDFGPQISPVLSTSSSLKYKSIQIPPFADLAVYVSHFVSPNEFYLHVIRKDYTIALKNIHTLIENEFKNPRNIVKITDIEVDQPVMCLNEDGGWFRSIVVEKKSERECKVVYVDFGIPEIVSIDHIASIQSKFLSDPIQAICCCLCEADRNNHSIINLL